MLIRYKVSEKEIARRENAFLSLSISLWVGSVLASTFFDFPTSYLFLAGFALFLTLMNFWLKKFFDKYLGTKIYLSKKFLIRGRQKFLLSKIVKLKIKRTINNKIREIEIILGDGKNVFVNGLCDFERFEINLLKTVDRNLVIYNIGEPIDFDSVFFYPVLGLILSFSTVYLFRSMTDFSYQTREIILFFSIAYVFLMGIYFIISKPISKRY